jgi:hypothetical protein
LRISDVDAELLDRACIVFGSAASPRKGAADRLRGAEDETPATGHIAGQSADLHPTLCARRTARYYDADGQTERADRQTYFLEHAYLPPSLVRPSFLAVAAANDVQDPGGGFAEDGASLGIADRE